MRKTNSLFVSHNEHWGNRKMLTISETEQNINTHWHFLLYMASFQYQLHMKYITRHDRAEILRKMALNTNQSMKKYISQLIPILQSSLFLTRVP